MLCICFELLGWKYLVFTKGGKDYLRYIFYIIECLLVGYNPATVGDRSYIKRMSQN